MAYEGQRATITSTGEMYITETERETNVYASYSKSAVSATAYACLIDLSNNTNWKHVGTGRVDISYLSIQVDKDNSATGNVSVGVITRVDGTNADVNFFSGLIFSNASEQHLQRLENFSPSQIKLGITGGNWNFGFGTKTLNIAAINTSTPLDSALGTATITPAVGDVIIRFERSAGTFTGAVRTLYHGHPTAS